ncbi:MAG: thiamine-phosphate kinase [Candidatus Omnitrophica bacterium]|nr:thiamine-phosphate kinase [Candidatus Omnitrophota bacterium]
MIEEISHIGEFGLIQVLTKGLLVGKNVKVGVGDDTAVIAGTSREDMLFTTDMMVEGGHFTKKMSPFSIGHKALACNISDIAAMGGVPTFGVVSLGVPGNLDIAFVKDIYAGINRLAEKFNVRIVGGDTVKSARIIINIALLGKVAKGQAVLRSGAKKGDAVFVTGPLGRSFKTEKHLQFVPRVKEAQFLMKNCRPAAMIDISDGLAADLGHILKQSNVGAQLHEEAIPMSAEAGIKNALYDGEDFELLFTVPERRAEKVQQNKKYSFYKIGKIVEKRKGLFLLDKQGNKERISLKGYDHFAN